MTRNLEIRQYQKGDENCIEPVEEMSRLLRNHPQYKVLWDEIIKPERMWTGLSNGLIVALGGIDENGMIWVMLDRNAATCKKLAVMRLFREGFKRIINSNGFIRLYTYVKKDVDKTEGIFARHFGFKVVGEKQFGGFTYLKYEWQRQ